MSDDEPVWWDSTSDAYEQGKLDGAKAERERWEVAAKRVIGHDAQLHTALLVAVAAAMDG